jgi:uncharacterized protein (UPF0264 family)
VPQLLVSVRSAQEARIAAAAGASIIDIKEPLRGPLGMAGLSVWREVREVVPTSVPVSVALGELSEWLVPTPPTPPKESWHGLSYRKIGLAGAGPDWRSDWRDLRSRLERAPGPPWIAVAYADWQAAGAPDPDSVLEAALESPAIVGILVDTWDKRHRPDFDHAWRSWMRGVKSRGKLLALAGGMDLESIPALEAMSPDIIAVRGAACVDGDRTACIDPERVGQLASAISRPDRPAIPARCRPDGAGHAFERDPGPPGLIARGYEDTGPPGLET